MPDTLNSTENIKTYMEVAKVGTVSVTRNASSAQTTTTIAHGMGYAPAYLAFRADSDTFVSVRVGLPVFDYTAAGAITAQSACSVDNTNIYFTVSRSSSDPAYGTAETHQFRYYIFKEVS